MSETSETSETSEFYENLEEDSPGEESDESESRHDDANEDDDDDDDEVSRKKLEGLISALPTGVNLMVDKERREFLRKFYPLIFDWKRRFPDLRLIFTRAEIDLLILEDLKDKYPTPYNRGHPIIKFIIKAGYEDEPEKIQDDQIIVCRTTPIHRAARCSRFLKKSGVIGELFKIYNKYEVNYRDETSAGGGLTHFHVACKFGLYEVVRKFLEQPGRVDPNCAVRATGDTPLHLALLAHNRLGACCNVVVALLKAGADPNLANRDGSTPLHAVCARPDADDDSEAAASSRLEDRLVQVIFRICEDRKHPLRLDAEDAWGRTPLRLAQDHRRTRLAEFLRSRGAQD
ncbi:unnamed protein product [Trichogramma brassicae]|uniref:Uncharacterized protein n=1 Tax=Trichogramma brassicae TaxID=86971 RepID=A0A6H5J0Z4_9HYME|nr:unnamed protein product [Trichogramma brassicae]